MEQRLSLVTLGVADLGRAQDFYGRLGWTPTGDPPAHDPHWTLDPDGSVRL